MAKEREHAAAILQMASKDFDALRGMLASDQPELFSDEIFGFHAQQAVEKSLKSWIALVGHMYPKSHDLISLIDVLADAGEDVQGLDELTELNPFAVQFRYEAFDEVDEAIDRPALLAEVELLLRHVEARIASHTSEATTAVDSGALPTADPTPSSDSTLSMEEE